MTTINAVGVSLDGQTGIGAFVGAAIANNGVLISSASGVSSFLAAGTTGQVLIATTSNPPSWGTLSSIVVTSISGTANQIAASASTGAVTLSFTNGISIGSYQATSPPAGGIIAPGQVSIGTSTPTTGAALTLGAASGIYYQQSLTGTVTADDGTSSVGLIYQATYSPTNNNKNVYGMFIDPSATPHSTNTIPVATAGYFKLQGTIGSGAVTTSYSGYFVNPTLGTTACALYSDNLSIGYTATTPPTNGAIFNGNVGIGISAPNYQLSLGSNTGNTKLAIYDGGAGSSYGFGVQAAQFIFHIGDNTNKYSFFDSTALNNEIVTILGTGNVGIGASSPNTNSALQIGSNLPYPLLINQNITVDDTVASYGIYNSPIFQLANSGKNAFGLYSSIEVDPISTNTIPLAYAVYGSITGTIGSGHITTAYSGFFANPTLGTNKIALNAANLSVGYTATTPPSGGAIISGRLGVNVNNPAYNVEIAGPLNMVATQQLLFGTVNTLSRDGSGNLTMATNANGNIYITPSGSGSIGLGTVSPSGNALVDVSSTGHNKPYQLVMEGAVTADDGGEGIGFYLNNNFNLANSSRNVYAFNIDPIVNPQGTNSVSNAYGVFVNIGGTVGSGSVGNSYSGFFNNPAIGNSRIALYADNLSLGYQTISPPAGGAIISGNVSIGTISPAATTLLTLVGASATQTFISMTGTVHGDGGGFACGINQGISFQPTDNNINVYGINSSPVLFPNGTNAITNAYAGAFSVSGSVGGGSVTNAYSGYFSNPSIGTNTCALYSDNLSVGYTGVTPPSSGAIISGNLGVGINNPAARFTIKDGNAGSDQLQIYYGNSLGSSGGIEIINNYNNTTKIAGFKLMSISATTGAVGFYTSSGSGLVERMRIDQNGHVTVNVDINVGSGIVGVTSGSAASASYVGEIISSSINYASKMTLTNTTSQNLTSISLSAGDWDVWANVYFENTGLGTKAFCGINSTSATLPDLSLQGAFFGASSWQNLSLSAPGYPVDFSGGNVTYYLVVNTTSTTTATACGTIWARRRR